MSKYLKQVVAEQKKLLDLKDKRIAELERLLQIKEQSVITNVPNMCPSQWIPNPCQHEYPEPWNGTCPPSCKKCGQPASIPASIFVPYFTISQNPAQSGPIPYTPNTKITLCTQDEQGNFTYKEIKPEDGAGIYAQKSS